MLLANTLSLSPSPSPSLPLALFFQTCTLYKHVTSPNSTHQPTNTPFYSPPTPRGFPLHHKLFPRTCILKYVYSIYSQATKTCLPFSFSLFSLVSPSCQNSLLPSRPPCALRKKLLQHALPSSSAAILSASLRGTHPLVINTTCTHYYYHYYHYCYYCIQCRKKKKKGGNYPPCCC